MVVKQMIEPDLEPIFLPNSYRSPRKAALDAVGVTRQRCRKYDWVLEFDIKGLFDNLPHDLLLKAVRKNVQSNGRCSSINDGCASMEKDGEVIERLRGTPQGGVISPILANLFLHYAFDLCIERTHPDLPWCRYADDGLVHCRTEQEANALREEGPRPPRKSMLLAFPQCPQQGRLPSRQPQGSPSRDRGPLLP